jgi:hypothetical protein
MSKIDYKSIIGFFRSNFVLLNLPVIIALPFFLLQNEQEIANQTAGYAYYLLIVGILWKIIQHFMTNHFEKKYISAKKEETHI